MALLLLLDPNYQFIRANIQGTSTFSSTLQVLKPINVEMVSSDSSVLCSTSIIRNPQSLIESISTLDSSTQVDHQILTNLIGSGALNSYTEINHEVRVTTSSDSATLVTTYVTVDLHSTISGLGSVDGQINASKQLLSETHGQGAVDGRVENQVQVLSNLIGQGSTEAFASIDKQLNSLLSSESSLTSRTEVTKELRTSDVASGSCQAYMDITPSAQYVYLNASCSSSSSIDASANVLKAIYCQTGGPQSNSEAFASISHEVRSQLSSENGLLSAGLGIVKYINSSLVGAGSTLAYVNVVGEVPYKTFTKSVGVGRSNLVVYDKYEKIASSNNNIQTRSSKKEAVVVPFNKTEIV